MLYSLTPHSLWVECDLAHEVHCSSRGVETGGGGGGRDASAPLKFRASICNVGLKLHMCAHVCSLKKNISSYAIE